MRGNNERQGMTEADKKITERFAYDALGQYHYKTKDKRDSKGNLIREGYWMALSKVNAYCLLKLQKRVEEEGDKHIKLWSVLAEEVAVRRAKGELPEAWQE